MGANSSTSSKDNNHAARDLPPRLPPKPSSPRKFQSYHLPFVRKQNGFARLKGRLFGRKKQKSGTYERTLALLSSGCEPKNSTSAPPDPTAPIVYESRPSTDDLPNLRSLDYQLYYRNWGNDFLLTRSPPSHFSLAETGLLAIGTNGQSTTAQDNDDNESICDAVSLPDEQLMRRSNIVCDPYSEVIRRAVIEKPVKPARVTCNSDSLQNGIGQPEQVKVTKDSSNPQGIEIKDSNQIQQSSQKIVSSLSPSPARISRLDKSPARSPRSLKKKTVELSLKQKSPCKQEAPICPKPESRIHNLDPSTARPKELEPVSNLQSTPQKCEASTSRPIEDDVASTKFQDSTTIVQSLMLHPSVTQTPIVSAQPPALVREPSSTSLTSGGHVLPDPDSRTVICQANPAEDEGETLLRDIAEKEQRLKEKLSQVQSMLVNSVKASGGGALQASANDSSASERSGSVDDDAADRAIRGSSQSSDAIASVDSPWEEMDQPSDKADCGQNVSTTADVQQKRPDGSTTDTNIHTAIHVQMKSSEQLNILSEVGANVRHSSSPSSFSVDEKRSRSSVGSEDFYSTAGRHSPRGPRQICSKLTQDLLTNLEVDLGDFQEFLTLESRLDEKYELLPIETLLHENFYIGVTVDELSRCLRILAKYGLNLLKPECERPRFWNKIVAMTSNELPTHWLSIKGSKDILFQLGYREVGMSLVYAVAFQLERSVTAHWVVELLLAAYELNAHSLGSHPKSELFRDRNEDDLRQSLAGQDEDWRDPLDFLETAAEPIYENCARAVLLGGAEPSEDMFGRRTVVPWLSDKENRVSREPVTAAIQCGLCGSSSPAVRCEKCSNQIFCLSCDDMYHRHPKRLDHVRKVAHAPMLPPPRPPPKTVDPNKVPVPPPRRKKSQRSNPPSPVFGRKQFEQKPELPKKQFPLKFGSLKRFMPSGLSGRPPTGPSKESQSRLSSGYHPSSEYPGGGSSSSFSRPAHHDDFSAGTLDDRQNFGRPTWRNGSFRSDGPPLVRRNAGRHPNYDGQSNTADLSSSDADEEVRSAGRGSGSSFRGSGSASRRGDHDWPQPDVSMPPPPLPPPYGGMSNVMYPNNPAASLSRRNTMMNNNTLGRSSPFMMGRTIPGPAAPGAYGMQLSNSVCDLSTHPMIAGYPGLPQVQSMADLHRATNMEAMMAAAAAAPCGCRLNWIGPDAYGMWLPPAPCMIHSSTANLYNPMTTHHPGFHHPDNVFMNQPPPPHFGPMYNPAPNYVGHPAQSPKPSSNPPEILSSPSLERRASPATSARSIGSRRKPCDVALASATTAARGGGGGTRQLRSRSNAYRQKAADIGSTSEDDENDEVEEGEDELEKPDDYFSAGTSDDHDNDNNNRRATSTWECEHCTFINPTGSRICSVCCKTASDAGVIKPLTDKRRTRAESKASNTAAPTTTSSFPLKVDSKNGHRSKEVVVASSKDDGVYEDLSDVKPPLSGDDDVKVLSEMLERGLKIKESPKPPITSTVEPLSYSPSLKLKANWLSGQPSATPTTIQSSSTKKQSAAVQVDSTKTKVDQANSEIKPAFVAPPTQTQPMIEEDRKQFDRDVYTQVEMKREISALPQMVPTSFSSGTRNVTSTGTSPPPQSISTQTTPIESSLWTDAAEDPIEIAPSSATAALIQTSTISSSTSAAPQLQRSSSRMSLSGVAPGMSSTINDATSFGPAPYPSASSTLKRAASLHFPATLSGGGGGSSGFVDNSSSSSSQYVHGSTGYMYRAGSRTSLMSDHPFGYSSGPPSRDASPPRSFLSRRDSERAYPGYSRFGHLEDRGFLPRSGSRKDYYLSLEELVERRRHETMRTQGLELVRLLREAELHNFTADDLQVALNHCGSLNPVQWLHENWRNMVDTVATLSTNFGRDKKENDVGIVSTGEAKECLRIHKGNIWAAVTECVEQRQRKVTDLHNRGNFTREEVLDALTSNSGSVEAAFDDLNKSNLKPFLMRIWGPPAGVDNEAGSVNSPFRFGPLNHESKKTHQVLVHKDNPYEKYSRNENAEMPVFAPEHLTANKDQSSKDKLNPGQEHLQQQDRSVDDDNEEEDDEDDDEEGDEKDQEEDELDEEEEEEELDEDEEEDLSEEDEVEEEEEVSEAAESVETAASPRDEEFFDTIPGSPVIEELKPQLRTSKREGASSSVSTPEPAVVPAPENESPSPAPSTEISSKDSPIASRKKSRSPSSSKDPEPMITQQFASKHQDALTSEFSRRVRQLLAEGKMATYEKAEVVVKLLDLRFEESAAIYAANECGDIYMAVSYLQQECELCAGKYPVEQMVSMLFCVHRCCRDCAKDYFTLKIKERTIMEAVCPFCNEPDLSIDSVAGDYFNNLDIMLKNLVDREVHELFQCKLRDRALMSDPNFHWCAKCASGFIAEENQRRLVCPDCKAISCALCKKPWERQHEGISCQQFADWKEANDPEYQAFGLEKYLAENGIDCPKCKFKYALAKGGCMHFTCSQCKFEFCSGCGKPFRMSKNCTVSIYCEKLGLHAHHPRNCLFYLRDKDPEELQKLLKDNSISYNVEPAHAQVAAEAKIRCPVMEQKELPNGNEDAMCGREVDPGNAGLCRLHYVEYLVSLVNMHRVDPLCIMDVGGLQQELRRADKPVPEQKKDEPDGDYQKRLVQVIIAEIPLAEA